MSPFSRDDIPLVLRAYVPTHAALTYPTQGMTSDVAFVDGDINVVIKRCREAIYLPWLAREHRVLLALAGSGLPIPRVLDYAEVGDVDQSEAWIVMTRLPGGSLWSEMVDASSQRRAELLRGVGQLLKQLHAAPVPSALVATAPWIDRTLAQARENLVWCDGTAEQLAELHRRRPAPVPDVLVHGDLALDNVLIDSRGVMRLIDWSGGDQGDPRYDVALALQTKPEIELGALELAAFFDGYGSVPFDDESRSWFEALYQFF